MFYNKYIVGMYESFVNEFIRHLYYVHMPISLAYMYIKIYIYYNTEKAM